MEFCEHCKSLMYPNGDKLVCSRCGFARGLEGEQVIRSSHETHKDKKIAVHETKEDAGLPTTKAICQKCGNNTAYWWMRQLRSADESEVRFFRCTECGVTWREYN